MIYVASKYVADNTTSIDMYTAPYELWCHASVNLSDYGMKPTDENHIFIPVYKLDEQTLETLSRDLVAGVTKEFTIGDHGAKCIEAKLKDNWMETCVVWA